MIRLLAEKDRQMTVEFLSEEPSINLFALGDIENFGFEHEKQDLWGQFSDEGSLEGVLLRYRNNYIPYYKNESADQEPFKTIIIEASKKGDILISGRLSILKAFDGLLAGYNFRPTYFCELSSGEQLLNSEYTIKRATVDDAKRVYDLITTIEEFSADVPAANYRLKIEEGSGRIYYIEDEDGLMQTVVQTTAECKQAAMIVGVATRRESRGKGMMSACLSEMCKDLLSEGKTMCLFYDNPKAGHVYHKLGFEPIDQWVMMKKG